LLLDCISLPSSKDNKSTTASFQKYRCQLLVAITTQAIALAYAAEC
jgi:hypothetical protein